MGELILLTPANVVIAHGTVFEWDRVDTGHCAELTAYVRTSANVRNPIAYFDGHLPGEALPFERQGINRFDPIVDEQSRWGVRSVVTNWHPGPETAFVVENNESDEAPITVEQAWLYCTPS